MRSIMTTNATVHQQASQKSTPQVFTDEELSEIFQINFAEIFGSSSDKPLPSKTGNNATYNDGKLASHVATQ